MFYAKNGDNNRDIKLITLGFQLMDVLYNDVLILVLSFIADYLWINAAWDIFTQNDVGDK